MSYHAGDDGQGADVLTVGGEHITVGEVPPDGHVGGDVLSGVDGVVSGTHAMNGGLENEKTSSSLSSSSSWLWPTFMPAIALIIK